MSSIPVFLIWPDYRYDSLEHEKNCNLHCLISLCFYIARFKRTARGTWSRRVRLTILFIFAPFFSSTVQIHRNYFLVSLVQFSIQFCIQPRIAYKSASLVSPPSQPPPSDFLTRFFPLFAWFVQPLLFARFLFLYIHLCGSD